jgi:iron-sulfur cluster repair protein YtfE (RIC family)
MSYLETLRAEHRACDLALTRIELAAHGGDWDAADAARQDFAEQTEAHFRYEEEHLFPALAQAFPAAAAGPIPVMQSEHRQMRELFADLVLAVRDRDAALLADTTQTLLFLMQQHNAKEENVLYPMADRGLPPRAAPAPSSKIT